MVKTYKTINKESKIEIQKNLNLFNKNKQIEIINYNCSIEDILTYLNEPFCLREGFQETEDKYICPNFFVKINGINDDILQKMKDENLNIGIDFDSFVSYDDELILKNINNINKILPKKNKLLLLNQKNLHRFLNIIEKYLKENKLSEKQRIKLVEMIISLPFDLIDKMNSFNNRTVLPPIIIEEIFDMDNFTSPFSKPKLHLLKILNLYGFDVVLINQYGQPTIENMIDIEIIDCEIKKQYTEQEKEHEIIWTIKDVFFFNIIPLIFLIFLIK